MSSSIFCLIVALTSSLTAWADQEVSSPLRVAQCRATCLQKFSNDSPSGESMCLQGPDCFMCWENCELLQSNFQVWGSMCQEKEICFPGCQQACAFHASAARSAHQTQPVIHTKGEGVIRVSGPLARWPAPGDEPAPADPIVYVVMRRSATGPWRQIIQTVSLATRVPPTTEGALLRVLVVDPRGLVTIYSPDESWTRFEASLKKKKTSGDDPLATTPESYLSELRNHVWSLKEVSLIHQKVLVIGEIAWEPRIMKGVYLVTWEVDGGGLKGNLFTDSTSVTLSLWPDTIYHIQVELVSRMPGIENEKSEMMTLDTSRAQRVSTESAEDAAGERAARDESADELYSVLVSSMRGRRAGARPAAREPLLGACAAIALFALVAAALAWRRRRHGTFPGTNVYIGDSSVRSRKLVEDFLPVKGFHPILTMVSDAPAASPLRAAPAPDVQV